MQILVMDTPTNKDTLIWWFQNFKIMADVKCRMWKGELKCLEWRETFLSLQDFSYKIQHYYFEEFIDFEEINFN